MNVKAMLKHCLNWASDLVWMIGAFTIVWFLVDHWPRTTYTLLAVAGVGALVWFLWNFFVRPFRAALNGNKR
jgi:hypothetical protein